jgi:hypothetical protein
MKDLKKIITTKIREYLNESSKGDIMRDVLKDKFNKENEISEFILTNQNKAEYEIILFLIKIGFYKNTEYNIHYSKNSNFKVSPSDYLGSFKIVDFINEHKKYLAKKYNISTYNITDEIWDNSINNIIKPNIEKILSNYNFVLSATDPLLYGGGDLLINLKTPNTIEYSKKYPQFVMQNPDKIITSKEFMGIEDRLEKRKFITHIVDNVEYKFLLNPLKQDKYFYSGDEGVFGQLFGGLLSNFLDVKNLDFESVILQIHKDLRNYNFVIGGDGFYNLKDVEEFKKNEDFNIKKIDTNHRFYNDLVDLKSLYNRLNSKNIKMIVFFEVGGDLTQTKNGGLLDKRSKSIFHPYIIKK